nr:hypothetical protein [uncultured bacterium]AMP54311.1 hypothetical protein [uncultured bacterium]AMP54394.1 hypothetical protein [uncultured bacterium]
METDMFSAKKIRRQKKDANNATTVFGDKRRAQKKQPTVTYSPPETNVSTPSPQNDDILDRKLRALSFVNDHSPAGVSRARIAEELGVSAPQALYVLNKLRDEGSIVLSGKKWVISAHNSND